MQTLSGALGALIVALLVTGVAYYVVGIQPDQGPLVGLVVTYVCAALGRLVFPPPSWDRAVSGFSVVPALLAAAIPWIWWGAGSQGDAQLPPPACNALVRLSLVSGKIEAKPYRTCLHRGRSVDWEIEAGAEDEVELQFRPAPQWVGTTGSEPPRGGRGAKGEGAGLGPFVPDPNNPNNPSRGVYRRKGPGDIDSNTAELLGRWEYSVTWRQPGLPPITTNSPMICIRK